MPVTGTGGPRPTHVPLPGSRWSLWREVAVRSSGFPVGDALRLGDPALSRWAARVGDVPDSPDWAGYVRSFTNSVARFERALQDVAGRSDFRCAVAWQNHHVVDRAVHKFHEHRPERGRRSSRHRQRTELVASYWQRYCLKNDTIGFFGPVGWASVHDHASTRFRPRDRGPESWQVYLEPWAVERLARALVRDLELEDLLPPVRSVLLHRDGGRMWTAGDAASEVGPVTAEILDRCTGEEPAGDIVRALVESGRVGDPQAAFRRLRELHDRGWIRWGLMATAGTRPEVDLRGRVSHLGDPVRRRQALDRLDALIGARDRLSVDSAPSTLLAGLRAVDDVFVAEAGAAPSRHHGRTYGGRTLVYLDARRPLDLRLGTDLVDALEPIGSVLDSARWFTHQLGGVVRAELERVHRELNRGGTPVTLAALLAAWDARERTDVRDAYLHGKDELRRHWTDILSTPSGRSRHDMTVDDLRMRVADRFSAPDEGWRGARHVSADILVASADPDALGRGEFRLVLGEIHPAVISLGQNCFVGQHPKPGRLSEALDVDDPQPRLLPLVSARNVGSWTVRGLSGLVRDVDHLVALDDTAIPPLGRTAVPASEVLIESGPGSLVARLPAGAGFDVLDAVSERLMSVVVEAFGMIDQRYDHLPRVTVGRVVLRRETWCVQADEMGFAQHIDEARRFAAAVTWAGGLGLPRRVFVKSPIERKPLAVDLASPIYVSLLAKYARRLQRSDCSDPLVVTEMMPDDNDLWLSDPQGRRYTSELRFVAVADRPPPSVEPERRAMHGVA